MPSMSTRTAVTVATTPEDVSVVAATLTMVKAPKTEVAIAATNAGTYSLTRIRNGCGRDGSNEMQELLGWCDLLSRAEKSQQDRDDVSLHS